MMGYGAVDDWHAWMPGDFHYLYYHLKLKLIHHVSCFAYSPTVNNCRASIAPNCLQPDDRAGHRHPETRRPSYLRTSFIVRRGCSFFKETLVLHPFWKEENKTWKTRCLVFKECHQLNSCVCTFESWLYHSQFHVFQVLQCRKWGQLLGRWIKHPWWRNALWYWKCEQCPFYGPQFDDEYEQCRLSIKLCPWTPPNVSYNG